MSDSFPIERLPSSWDLVPFEECCTKVADNRDPRECKGKRYLGLEHLSSGFPSLIGVGDGGEIVSAKTGYRTNDILFGKLRPYLRKGLRVTFEGVCSTDIFVFRTKSKTRPDYLGYLIHADPFARQAIKTTTGVNHPRTSWDGLKRFHVPRPPETEQRQIARVLSAVQRAIERQERLMALTAKLKKALMHKLFTEGTRGEPLKQTEIGPVPESWDLVELKSCCRVQTGFAFKSDDYVSAGDGIAIVKIGDLQLGSVLFSERSSYVPTAFWDEPKYAQYRLKRGDFLIALTGATTGKTGEVGFDGRALLNQRVGRFLPDNKRLLSTFLKYLVPQAYFQRKIQANILVAAQGNISPKSIERFLVALPTPDEQATIAEMLMAVDRRNTAARALQARLEELFRTVLHQLMTAQVRVHDLDLSALDEAANEPLGGSIQTGTGRTGASPAEMNSTGAHRMIHGARGSSVRRGAGLDSRDGCPTHL